ncbi:MAG: aminoglycoside phosphotransferase family protein [Alphaproteobacteria bacterium]
MTARALPQDRGLPQLACVLDARRMAREFETRMFGPATRGGSPDGGPFRLRDCRIERIKYQPGKKCTIGYRLSIDDRRSGRSHNQLLSARAFAPGASHSRYQKAKRQVLVSPQFGPPVMHIEPLEMVVWAFPNERKIENLAALTDAGRLRNEILRDIVERHWGPAWRIATVSPTLAHYIPEHTCCIRAALDLCHRRTGEKRPWVVFGKTYYDDRGADAHADMQRLWDGAARIRGALSIPRPLGYQPAYRVLWQEGLAGETFEKRYGDDGADLGLVGKAAEAVADLHTTSIGCRRRTRPRETVSRLLAVTSRLERVRPSCATTAAAVVQRLMNDRDRLPDAAKATLHGDLHTKNMLVAGDRVSLIDLDTLSEGPPSYDIGSFVAAALYRAILCRRTPASTRPMVEMFLGRYRARVPWAIPRSEIAWHTAAALIAERAGRCISRLKAGRLEIVDDLVALADRISRGTDDVLAAAGTGDD